MQCWFRCKDICPGQHLEYFREWKIRRGMETILVPYSCFWFYSSPQGSKFLNKKPKCREKDCLSIPNVEFGSKSYINLEISICVKNVKTELGWKMLRNWVPLKSIKSGISIYLTTKIASIRIAIWISTQKVSPAFTLKALRIHKDFPTSLLKCLSQNIDYLPFMIKLIF